MRILWTLFKVVVGLAIAIPLSLIALGVTFGLVGAAIGLLFIVAKLAVVGLIGYGLFRAARFVFGSSAPATPTVHALPPRDPYYEAAMRELDKEIGK